MFSKTFAVTSNVVQLNSMLYEFVRNSEDSDSEDSNHLQKIYRNTYISLQQPSLPYTLVRVWSKLLKVLWSSVRGQLQETERLVTLMYTSSLKN
jgi:hypothetical protein